MRILVTGGSGYIGTRLMQALAARDEVQEIVDVDLRPPALALDKVRYVSRSVTEDLRDLFTDRSRPVDVAMHLAWVLDPMRDRAKQREVCIGGSNRFLDGCVAGEVRQVLFMSSATAYGAHPDNTAPLEESAPLRSEYHFQYSAEKREAEGLFQRFAADRPGTLLQIARPCVVGGPHVSNFIFRAMDRAFNVCALGHDPHVQLIHEDDCAAALVAIVRSRRPGAFNVSSDDALRFREVSRLLGARVVPLPLPLMLRLADFGWRRGITALTEAPMEATWFFTYPWVVSNRRLREEAGFTPRYSAREVLASFVAARGRRATAPATQH
jgi:UDP-glucose 4-epimerase